MRHKYMKFLIIIAFFLFSCSSSQKADKLFDKAIRTDKEKVMERVSELSRVEYRYVRDTIKEKEYIKQNDKIITQIDTFLNYIKEIDTSNVNDLRIKLNDSYEYIEGLQDLLSNIPILVDTIYQKDGNEAWLLKYNYDILNKDLLKEKSKRVRDLWVLVIITLLCALLITYSALRK